VREQGRVRGRTGVADVIPFLHGMTQIIDRPGLAIRRGCVRVQQRQKAETVALRLSAQV
jgi:hypothetical protein